MDETQRAIEAILDGKGLVDAPERAARARASMEQAFEDALVAHFSTFLGVTGLPDPGDAHVIAAALKTQAAVIVTDNLKHFPEAVLAPLNIEARSADTFIADTIALDPGKGVESVKLMRQRFRRPEKTASALLLDMEAGGLTETADVLRPFIGSM